MRRRADRQAIATTVLMLAAAACGQDPESTDAVSKQDITTLTLQQRSAETSRQITLITGDRVTVRAIDAEHTIVTFTPAVGREHISYVQYREGGNTFVIPSDLAAATGADQIDRALFNVTQLLAEGYGDAQRNDTPLIVTGAGSAKSTAALSGRLAHQLSATSSARSFSALGMMALRAPKRAGARDLTALLPSKQGGRAAAPPVKLWLDRRLRVSLDHSVPQIGAPAAYALGLDGAGVKVAVLDTGIDASHPDLAGKVVDEIDLAGDGTDATDKHGHGTHVASTIAGSGAASAGRFHGVAPGAQLLNGRVCDEFGGCEVSAILAGMEWAVAHGAQIVNLSLGGTDFPEIDPLEEAVNRLSAEHGTLFVIAAGNSGSRGTRTIDSPGSADAALCVGAVDRDDVRASFSGQGPRVGDHAMKPDVTAPGVGIVAARASDGSSQERYVAFSGTSMATPHVAGAAALVLQQHPSWSGQQLKAAMMGSAAPSPATSAFQQGAGRIDVARAVSQPIHAEPATLNLGTTSFPHDDDEPILRTMRYHNHGTSAIALTFQAHLTTFTGVIAPANLVTFSPSTAVVPAGSSVDVEVTVDTRVPASDGIYGGELVASGGGARVITTIGVEREVEAHDLKVFLRAKNGEPSYGLVTVMAAAPLGTPQRDASRSFVTVVDHETFRLPVGSYLISSFDYEDETFLLAPRVTIGDRDDTLIFDGQLARPTALTMPEPSFSFRNGNWDVYDAKSQYQVNISPFFGAPLAMAQLGASAPPGEVTSLIRLYFEDLAQPDRGYHAARADGDAMPTGWTQTFREREFARVESDHAAAPGQLLTKYVAPIPAHYGAFAGPFWDYPRPFHRTDFYYSSNLRWFSEVLTSVPEPEFPDFLIPIFSNQSVRSYRTGHVYPESWNRAPFGAAFPGDNTSSNPPGSDAPTRTGAQLRLAPSRFSDSQTPATFSLVTYLARDLKLFRNGEPFASPTGQRFEILATIPAEPAEYRLETSSQQPDFLFESSTKVAAAWTFRARAGQGTEILPLPTVRFAPPLDEHNRATGPALLLPISVERPLGSPRPAIADLDVELSFDDGATWRRLPVLRLGDRALGLVLHPPGAAHVSLRGAARDVAGNRGEQTILRAYLIDRR